MPYAICIRRKILIFFSFKKKNEMAQGRGGQGRGGSQDRVLFPKLNLHATSSLCITQFDSLMRYGMLNFSIFRSLMTEINYQRKMFFFFVEV